MTLHAAGVTLRAPAGADATLKIRGRVRIDGLTLDPPAGGGAMGVRIEATGDAELRGLRVSGACAAQVFVAEWKLTLVGAQLEGGEYGLLTQAATALAVRHCRLSGQHRAGIAVVNGPAELRDNQLSGPFVEAALALLHSEATLAANEVTDPGAMGIKVTNGGARFEDNRVEGAQADARGLEGNGIYLYAATGSFAGDRLSNCGGAELALIGSRAALDRVVFDSAKEVAIYLSNSRLEAKDTLVRRSPSGVVLERDASGADGDGGFPGIRFDGVPLPVVWLAP